MKVTIPIDVENCDECPYAEISKVQTADWFEDVRQIKCKKSEKIVFRYLDWNEKSPVPDECPFNT